MSGNVGIDLAKFGSVIEETLKKVPHEQYGRLPEVLLEKGQTRYFVLCTEDYVIIDFLDDTEAQRISALQTKGYFPFPGLIKPKPLEMSAAFHFEKTKYAVLQGCSISNMFSFSLGKDSTIVIQNHQQQIKTEELQSSVYTIKLAYLISFGDEITKSNIFDVVKDLLLESFKMWGIALG